MNRRVRSDKKVDCKPTVSMNLKECIYRISYITMTPVKDVSEEMCLKSITSKKVIEYLSVHFKRDFRVNNTYYMGDINRETIQSYKKGESTGRITIKFQNKDYEKIRTLAFALGVTPTKATSILLETSLMKTNFINSYAKQYIKETLDDKRMKELKKVMGYINQNTNSDEKISWSSILSFVYDEIRTTTNTVNQAFNKWIDDIK